MQRLDSVIYKYRKLFAPGQPISHQGFLHSNVTYPLTHGGWRVSHLQIRHVYDVAVLVAGDDSEHGGPALAQVVARVQQGAARRVHVGVGLQPARQAATARP